MSCVADKGSGSGLFGITLVAVPNYSSTLQCYPRKMKRELGGRGSMAVPASASQETHDGEHDVR